MTTQTQTNISELEELRKQLERLERRVARLERERDEAREAVIAKVIGRIVSNFCRYKGLYLPSDAIRDIRMGRLTLAAAIADRNAQWPLLTYGEPGGLTLAEAFEVAL